MMLVSENGTAYSDGHFHIENGLIINNFTKRMVGRLISTKESTNYLCIHERTLIQKMIRWFWEKDEEYQRKHNIPPEAHGSLIDTMNGLREEDR